MLGQSLWERIGLRRCLASHPAEVAVIVEHITLIALQSLEYGVHSVFLDRLSGSSGKKFKAGFGHRIASSKFVDELYGH